ncbi:MAG: RnfABCDGE type electron transport complex subunit B [Lautropia sp.]|nr:RnfABCDGE type electron transport complex subunit B [Lautropia sp.]
MPISAHPLEDRIDGLLPQTQCRRCGFDDCHGYALALARGESEINRCPPGGDTTIIALAALLQRPALPLADDLEPMAGRQIVRINPGHCIGCTKCILACPVDAIVGAARFQHQVLTDRCTGCELCLPPCPTDCIEVLPLAGGWQDSDADHGRRHHRQRDRRMAAERARERERDRRLERHALDPTTVPSDIGHTENTRIDAAGRDPLVVLADADEKARRLAAIRDRLKSRPATGSRP